MPSLTNKTLRRKKVTPVTNLHEDDVWQRTFKLMGLEPLTPFPVHLAVPTLSMSADGSTATGESGMIKENASKTTLESLPIETQRAIFSYASSTDLIALSLVSRHFRDIAAAQLYRNFHIVFPDDDDPSYDSPIDSLAGGLDTFVTSEYDYSQYLREIVLDTLSGGQKGERAYRHYTYDMSCGKFLNTLFLLTLRKAKSLETFRWDLRIELSRPVFKALHQIPSLQHVHLRMQAGRSIYETPPPLPSLAESGLELDQATAATYSSLPAPPPFNHGSVSYNVAKQTVVAKPKGKSASEPEVFTPPTVSGFRNLQSLSVLDMDSLDYVTEVNACIGASTSTLKKLKLSFSENLARQARKPPPAEDLDESDQEIDEFGNVVSPPPPPPPQMSPAMDDASAPNRAFKAQEEKKNQEQVLARIFGIDLTPAIKNDKSPTSTSDSAENPDEAYETAGKAFIRDLTSMSKSLMSSINGPGSRTQQQKETLEIIEKAAKKYVESTKEEMKNQAVSKPVAEVLTTGTGIAKAPVESDTGTAEVVGADVGEATSAKESEPSSTGRKGQSKTISSRQGPQPDDINIYEPETEFDLNEVDENQAEVTLPSPLDSTKGSPEKSRKLAEEHHDDDRRQTVTNEPQTIGLEPEPPTKSLDSRAKLVALTEAMAIVNKLDLTRITDLDDPLLKDSVVLHKLAESLDDVRAKLRSLQLRDLKRRTAETTVTTKSSENKALMEDYVRKTRGLSLRTLAIYLIPMKTSVLTKAVDLHVLRRVTLLNVGSQAPFWNLLAKENKVSPLPLCKIHTDNVTTAFLLFVSQLKSLTELFLLERSSKVKESSLAPPTTVSIDDLRRQILKKHSATLERLVIKNDQDYSWDANDQTIKLLCKKGKKLVELGINISARVVHTFNQYLPGLVSLRAMHIINFRNDDTCLWVLREIRHFVVDCVSHNPEMKLEYLAVENNVERLVKRAKKPKSSTKDSDKGKGKSASISPATVFPTLDSILTQPYSTASSEDDTDDSDDDKGPGLRLETMEGVRFYDVFGIRMWKKEVLLGRI